MPSQKALHHALKKLLPVPFTILAPQHGSVITDRKIIQKAFELLAGLRDVGIDALVQDGYRLDAGRIQKTICLTCAKISHNGLPPHAAGTAGRLLEPGPADDRILGGSNRFGRRQPASARPGFKYAATEKQLYRLNRELLDQQERIHEDLAAAAEIQRSLLPRRPADYDQFEIAWTFEPSAHIAGDIFNVIRLAEHRWGIYALDVSGHGVPAAMVAVSVYQNLQPASGSSASPIRGWAPSQSAQAGRGSARAGRGISL